MFTLNYLVDELTTEIHFTPVSHDCLNCVLVNRKFCNIYKLVRIAESLFDTMGCPKDNPLMPWRKASMIIPSIIIVPDESVGLVIPTYKI